MFLAKNWARKLHRETPQHKACVKDHKTIYTKTMRKDKGGTHLPGELTAEGKRVYKGEKRGEKRNPDKPYKRRKDKGFARTDED